MDLKSNSFEPTLQFRINIIGIGTPIEILQQLWIDTSTGKKEWRDVPKTYNAPYKE